MRDRTLQRLIRSTAWFLWALCWLFGLQQIWNLVALPGPESWLIRSILAGTALVCLRVARRGAPRLASASLITLLVLLPDPWSLGLGLLVLSAGARWRSRRDRRHPIQAISAVSVAWSVAYALLASGLLPPLEPAWLQMLVRVVVAWWTLEALTWGLAQPLEAGRRSTVPFARGAELLNPLIAALLAGLESTAGPVAVLAAPLTIAGQVLLVRLDQARRELRRARKQLDSRTTELLTVHAIGQELSARSDDRRLGPLLDRECRKLFDPDGFLFWLAEDTRLRVVYQRHGERHSTEPAPADPKLSHWLQEEKRGLCWTAERETIDFKPLVAHTRSALIAPLLVEQRVAGAVIVESRRENAYDEHHLAVLTTVAQQAAAALESAQQQRRATIDSLTGFFLREYFFQRLEEEQRRARRYGGRFALMMLDLDGFKAINDRHGHLAGDRYLRAAAATIRGQLRGADMPCRYGGDEFSLLLPETGLGGACTIAERIRDAVARLEVESDGVFLRGTVSIGLAAFPDHSTDAAQGLLQRADEALYRAKRAGRDRVVPYAA